MRPCHLSDGLRTWAGFAMLAFITSTAWPSARPVSVSDCIAFSTLAERTYFLGGSSSGRTAIFSPDHKRFVVVLKRGDVTSNVNVYSVLLFDTARILTGDHGTIVLEMSSSSNRDAISRLRWINNDMLAFIGENQRELGQVHTFTLTNRRLRRLTASSTPVTSFDISANGQAIVFSVEPSDAKSRGSSAIMRHIDDEGLFELISGKRDPDGITKEELFVQSGNGPPMRIDSRDYIFSEGSFQIAMSPDGRHAVLPVMVTDVPDAWMGYQERYLAFYVREKRTVSRPSRIMRYNLLNVRQRTIVPLIDAPISWSGSAVKWGLDGKSLTLADTYLPLVDVDTTEKALRTQRTFSVIVSIPDRKINLAPQAAAVETGQSSVEVALQEDFQSPPKLVAIDRNTKQSVVLRDLNPNLSALRLARRETFTWQTSTGQRVIGGLFYPPDYQPGKRYPLVIQTHGFSQGRFQLDGPWSSAYAAEPLAARNIVVLQMAAWDPKAKRETVNTPQEGPFEMAAYESAVAELDKRGIVDSSRVGITGFSRTFYTVGYTLTHSKLRFAAAVLTDGFDGGYLQYLTYPRFRHELEGLYGGPPHGARQGTWVASAPGFTLGSVTTPVRIVALGPSSLMKCWEWYSGLRQAGKAVDMAYLPDAAHLVVKPAERAVVQQGIVDWFGFWLQSETVPNAADTVRLYEEWRALGR